MLMQGFRLPRNVTEFPSEAGITPDSSTNGKGIKKVQPEADLMRQAPPVKESVRTHLPGSLYTS